jgi:hypothetical protein
MKMNGGKRYWEVTVPLYPTGRKRVRFRLKSDARKYFKACEIELRRTGRVALLSSRQVLVDCVEACRMLKGVKGRSKMREAAALYLEAKTAIAKLRGEIPSEPYTEPTSRLIELAPGLHKVLSGMAAKRGVSLSCLAAGMLQQYLLAEGEKELPPLARDEVRRIRDCLQQAA